MVTACIVLHNFCENISLQFINAPLHSESCAILEQPQEQINDDAIQTQLREVNEWEHIRKALEIFITQLS